MSEPTKPDQPISWWSVVGGVAVLGIGLMFGGCIGTGVGYKLAQWGPKAPVVKPADPKPTDPVKPADPISEPSPISEPGFRVVIVEEFNERAKLPREQLIALTSVHVINYLNTSAVEWRLYDKDDDWTKDKQWAKDALARPRKSLPWVILGNGKTGFEGPYPKTSKEVLELFARYSGKPAPSVPGPTPPTPDKPTTTQPVAQKCQHCDGTGSIRRVFRTVTCSECNGTGVKP